MTNISYNIKTLMSSAAINASELARRTGVAQPIIYRLSTGQNINPKLGTICPISDYFTVTVSQLIGEVPLPSDPNYYRTDNHQRGWHRVPLITWQDALFRSTQPEKIINGTYVSTDANVSAQAFALRVKGSAMEPLFPHGATVVVEPNRVPQDRDYVVVQMQAEHEARLKQILIDGKDRYLKSINPELEDIQPILLKAHDRILGVMMQVKVDY